MQKQTLLYIISLLLLAACDNSIEITKDETHQMLEAEIAADTSKHISFSPAELAFISEIANGTPKIDKDSAIKVALQAMGRGKQLSKSGVSVTAFGTPISGLTKSSKQSVIDTTLYVVNSHGGGFAVVSADVRIPEQVLAYSEIGNLLLDSDNPVFAIFLDYAKDYAASCIAKAQEQRDSIENSICEKLGIYQDTSENNSLTKAKRVVQRFLITSQCYTVTSVETVAEVKPLLKTNWHQNSPYNDSVGGSCINNSRYVAGCVAVATAQLIAYWRYPKSMNGIVFDWDKLNNEDSVDVSEYKTQAASLIHIVGKSIKTEYGCSHSPADACSSLHLLWYLGYKVPTVMSVYKYDGVINCLNKGWPVFMGGWRTKDRFLVFFNEYENGHQWLADGYVHQKIITRNRLTYAVVECDDEIGCGSCRYEHTYSAGSVTEPKYLHINWGWQNANGYYCKDVFDVKERYLLGSDGQYYPNSNNIKEDRNYRYALEYAKDLHYQN